MAASITSLSFLKRGGNESYPSPLCLIIATESVFVSFWRGKYHVTSQSEYPLGIATAASISIFGLIYSLGTKLRDRQFATTAAAHISLPRAPFNTFSGTAERRARSPVTSPESRLTASKHLAVVLYSSGV